MMMKRNPTPPLAAMITRRSLRSLERLVLPGEELAALDRLSRRGDEIEQEAQIMQAEQPKPEDLLLVDEVADVGAAEARAGRAGAAVVERALVAGEAGVAEVEPTLARERAAGARGARRQDAVEHVDAARDHLEHALGVADSHEVARLLLGEERRGRGRRLEHRLAVLPHAEPADRVAVEVERDELLRRARAAARASRPPCVIAKRSWPGRARQVALPLGPRASSGAPPPRARRATTPAGGQMSRHIATSEPSSSWIARRELGREALRRCPS